MLAVSTAAQASTAAYFLGLAAVTPALRTHFGLDLPAVGALIGATSLGMLATLIAWGIAADRYGERPVMIVGLLGSAAFLAAAAPVTDPITVGALLIAAGAAGASVNAASGRAVLTLTRRAVGRPPGSRTPPTARTGCRPAPGPRWRAP